MPYVFEAFSFAGEPDLKSTLISETLETLKLIT